MALVFSRHAGMRTRWMVLAALLSASLAAPLNAHEYYTSNFKVVHPWANATEPDAKEAPVYFVLEDVIAADRLLRASSSMAERVELRQGGDANPAAAAGLEVPVADKVDYAPGQAHVVLVGLTAPLQWNRSYPMTLVFEKAGAVSVMISIGPH